MKAKFVRRHPTDGGEGCRVKLSILLYEDENGHYAYCPAFDMTGIGDDMREARLSLDIQLDEMIEEAVASDSLPEVLAYYGWTNTQPPKISELVMRDREFAEMIDDKEFRVVSETITFPEQQ